LLLLDVFLAICDLKAREVEDIGVEQGMWLPEAVQQ
jgi:hypothetical protein